MWVCGYSLLFPTKKPVYGDGHRDSYRDGTHVPHTSPVFSNQPTPPNLNNNPTENKLQ